MFFLKVISEPPAGAHDHSAKLNGGCVYLFRFFFLLLAIVLTGFLVLRGD